LEAPIFAQVPSNIAQYFGWNLLQSSDYQEKKPAQGIQPQPDDLLPLPIDSDEEEISIESRESSEAEVCIDNKEADIDATRIEPDDSPPKPIKKPETLNWITKKIDEILLNRNQVIQPSKEGQFPIYVVFTTQEGLQKIYGEKTTNIIDDAMRNLVAAFRKRLDWGGTLIYADDPVSMAQYGLKPVPHNDPWKLKLALKDLDDSFGKRGARIGTLLIVGGPEVVPFHNLPNPTDDTDSGVPSDNPYATKDENYFIPEWPVGRLPGGKGNDPGLIISTLRSITERYNDSKNKSGKIWETILLWIKALIQSRVDGSQYSFGYTAEAWKQASSSVFRPIGDPRALVTSPPVAIHNNQPLPNTKLGYFNLHGVQDSAEWFGQRDSRNSDGGPDYPVALQPNNVLNGDRAPRVVFSEACFGAHILDKVIDEALSLKFLASGSQAIIGSTVISYGSVTTPLNAADLLGKAFWGYFKEGFPAGESLRRAKIYLAKEMHQRQGYLDGEDQKTLISFVLYGDPLTQEKDLRHPKSLKLFPEPLKPPYEIKTICDRVDIPGTSEPIPKDIVANVKKIVDQYLPGMRDAKFLISHEHSKCDSASHDCPTSQLGKQTNYPKSPERRVVTLSKQIVRSNHIHESYARLTIDKNGHVVKLAVSR
jgi:hypothetical protein